TSITAIAHQMMQQQRDDLLVRQWITATIHRADAVGIAIRHEANIVWITPQLCAAKDVIFRCRFRANTAEHHIVLGIERGNFAGSLGEQGWTNSRTGAV